MAEKGDTKKDIDQSMKKSGVDKVVKEQAAEIRKAKGKK
jgi:hypothetical protein